MPRPHLFHVLAMFGRPAAPAFTDVPPWPLLTTWGETVDHAYVAGLVAAAGRQDGALVVLRLHGQDVPLLDEVRLRLGLHPPELLGDGAAALLRLPLVVPKAFVPVSADVEPAFWRGFLDARGALTWGPSTGWRIEVVDRPYTVGRFRQFLLDRGLPIRATVRPRRRGSAFILGGSDLVRQALRLIYTDDGGPAHPRKAALGRAIAGQPGRSDRVREATPAAYARLAEAGLDNTAIAARLGISRMTLWRLRQEWARA